MIIKIRKGACLMMSLLLLGVCALSLIALVGLVIGVIVIMQSNRGDAVSTAREDWINQRSEPDDEF
jgi:hypothetical protein